MLRCDDCQTDFDPHFVGEDNDDGWCPDCGGSLYDPACRDCGSDECDGDACHRPAFVNRTLRATPAALVRFKAIHAALAAGVSQ